MLAAPSSFRVRVNARNVDIVTGVKAVLTVVEFRDNRLQIFKQTQDFLGGSASFVVSADADSLIGVVGFEAVKNSFFADDGIGYRFSGAGLQSFRYLPGNIRSDQVLSFDFATNAPIVTM